MFVFGIGSEWLALPLMILLEVYLKLNAYEKNLPTGSQLVENYRELFLGSEIGNSRCQHSGICSH